MVTISAESIRKAKENNLGLLEFILLASRYEADGITTVWKFSDEVYDSLRDKGLFTKGLNISAAGRAIVETIYAKDPAQKDPNRYMADFEEYWETVPTHDGHSNFPKSRIIRTSKSKALQEYQKLRDEGVPREAILKGVNNEVAWRKATSNTSKGNKLKYMKSPARWLSEREYQNWQEDNTGLMKSDAFQKNSLDELS